MDYPPFDLVVIGSGPAGEKAAVKGAYHGKRVALIEKEAKVGGAGVNTGTLPSKTLKETAIYFSGHDERGLYPSERVRKAETRIDEFLYRQRLVRAEVEAEVRGNIASHGVTLIQGTAAFLDAHSIRVLGADGSTQDIRAANFIVATGSYPFQPDNIAFDCDCVHDSDTILELTRIPDSIVIAGAGVIGCEYATIFATMGVQVYLVNNSAAVLAFLDQQIATALVEEMRAAGVKILFNASATSVERQEVNDQVVVRTTLNNGAVLESEMFLYAAGRNGGTNGLALDKAGVVLGKRQAVVVNEHYRTNVPHIFAVGDVIGFPALAATGMDQGRVAISHMFDIDDSDRLPKILPYGIYTIPEVSMAGMTEEQARAQKLDYAVGVAHHALTHRGRIMGLTSGFLKIVFVRQTLVIVGCHLIGPLSAELIHFGLALVAGGKSVNDVIDTVFNYPTLHEIYKYACYDGLGNIEGKKMRQF